MPQKHTLLKQISLVVPGILIILACQCQEAFCAESPVVVLSQIHPELHLQQEGMEQIALSSPLQNNGNEGTLETKANVVESIEPHLEELDHVSTESNFSQESSQIYPVEIAQSVPGDTLGDNQALDLTPVSLPRRAPAFDRFDRFNQNMLYHLPSKLFFSAMVENSVRLETNVFQTNSRNSADFIYRVLPNITAGYAFTKRTRLSCNYFLLRDQYAKFNRPLSRDLQSVGFQLDHDVPLKGNANLTFGFFGRALFSSLDFFDETFFNDLIPSVTLTKPVGRNAVAYASCLGQVRFRKMLNQYQEFDQFYSGGMVYRKGGWTFLGDSTLASNFGRPIYRGGANNQVIILTEEVARKISHRLPLQTFIRSQQIFNMGAPDSPGFAGFNYRIFGGLRLTVAKQPIFPIKLKDI